MGEKGEPQLESVGLLDGLAGWGVGGWHAVTLGRDGYARMSLEGVLLPCRHRIVTVRLHPCFMDGLFLFLGSVTRPMNVEEWGSGPLACPPSSCGVLVVDDDDVVRDLIVALLRTYGVVHVSACSTSAEAFVACAAGGVDVLLVDRHLGGLDGIVLMERLRRVSPDGGPLMLLLTGDDDPLLARRALAAGAWDVVIKPVDPRGLAMRIDCLLRLHVRQQGTARVRDDAEANDPCEEIHEVGSVPCATPQTTSR